MQATLKAVGFRIGGAVSAPPVQLLVPVNGGFRLAGNGVTKAPNGTNLTWLPPM